MGNGGLFFPVRVYYRKEDRIKYISHLDMNRCVSRALKRSALPVWHTLGFNPHIYLTFALPLPLGYESLCESFDFRLTEQLSMPELVRRLQQVMPEGLHVYDASVTFGKPEEITQADFSLECLFEDRDVEAFGQRFSEWLLRPEILVHKRSKKGEQEVNVQGRFRLLSMQADQEKLLLSMRCAAGQDFNLNPTLLLDTFSMQDGVRPACVRVVRTAIYRQNGENFV